jgi:hypothetical protein
METTVLEVRESNSNNKNDTSSSNNNSNSDNDNDNIAVQEAKTTPTLVPLHYNYSKQLSGIGPHPFVYAWFGGKLSQVGPYALSYDMFSTHKLTKIGDHALSYGLQGRLNKVGNDLELHYDIMGGRLNAIGDCKLHYGIQGRLNQIGDNKLEYGFLGRLNGIRMLEPFTDDKLVIFLIAIRYMQEVKERAEQAKRERQAKMVLEGKAKVSSILCCV